MSLIYTTVPSEDVGRSIAEALVRRRLAACANMIPGMRALYLWKGKVEEEGETVLILKTQTSRVAELSAALVQLHPYEVPAIIELPAKANAAFADWIVEETGTKAGD
ncbi:MAG: divalent-cation tolerance protein CutA [Rhodobiaceae bacterium]|nr:divalent-cation tolerance protein CutA [Rhodobiaceae bacterium]MCC0055975.1 divalent-cation tolerance protein CutA [Rhodobiaceae bacterium]